MTARNYNYRVLVFRQSRFQMPYFALNARIDVFRYDGLNSVLRPSAQIGWRMGRSERAIVSLVEPNNDVSSAMIGESDDLLRQRRAMVIVGQVEPVLDLEIKCLSWSIHQII